MAASALRTQHGATSAARHRTSGDQGFAAEAKTGVTAGDLLDKDLSDCLQRAMTRLGIPVKAVAIEWDVNHAYVSRILANVDPLPDYRIQQLPKALRVAVLEEWAVEEGVVTGRRAALLKAIEGLQALATDDRLDVPVRMAKVDL